MEARVAVLKEVPKEAGIEEAAAATKTEIAIRRKAPKEPKRLM